MTTENDNKKAPQKLVTRRLTVGIRVSPEQDAFFEATSNCARIVFNDFISYKKADMENAQVWCKKNGYANLSEWAQTKGYKDYSQWRKANVPTSVTPPRTLSPVDAEEYITLSFGDVEKLVTTVAKKLDGTETETDFLVKHRMNYPEFEKIKETNEKTGKEYTKLSFQGRVSNPNRSFLASYDLPEEVKGLSTVKIPNVTLQQSCRDATQAIMKFHNEPKVKFPKWKKKTDRVGIRFTNPVIVPMGGKVYRVQLANLPNKYITVKIKKKDPFIHGRPTSVTIKKEATGRYSISFVVKELLVEPSPRTNIIAGVDLGFKDSATVVYRHTDGIIPDEFQTFENHRFFRKLQKDLKRKQRQLARMEPNSKNYIKKREELARYHSKIKNSRKRYNEEIAKTITDKSDFVSFETLNIAGMAKRSTENKHRRGGRTVSDTGLRSIVDKSIQKGEEQGKAIVQVPQNYASTQLCSNCGAKCGPKGRANLHVRRWTCNNCGAEHHRDQNASINILNKGLEILETASKGTPKKQKKKKQKKKKETAK